MILKIKKQIESEANNYAEIRNHIKEAAVIYVKAAHTLKYDAPFTRCMDSYLSGAEHGFKLALEMATAELEKAWGGGHLFYRDRILSLRS